MNYISFPGLGIDEFPLNKVAFSMFGRDVVWYGVIISIGILLAVAYVCYRAKNDEGIKIDDVFDYAIYLVFFGIIGARLYYVIMEFDSYKGNTIGQTLMNVIAIWEGGLAIYGGIIAGAIALVFVSIYKKINALRAFDMIAPSVMIGQILGRWGNFFNAEAYGGQTTLPWRMGIRTPGESVATFVHPTFLYESLWNLIGFILINIFYRKKRYNGQIVLMYITWYGFGRMFIEGLRTDSLYVGDLRISQVIAFLCFFIGLVILTSMEIVHHLRVRDERKALAVETAVEAEAELESEIEAVAENVENEADAVENDELMCEESLEALDEDEDVSELELLDGVSDEIEEEIEAEIEEEIEAEIEEEIEDEIEEYTEEEMFEISDNYSDDDDDEE